MIAKPTNDGGGGGSRWRRAAALLGLASTVGACSLAFQRPTLSVAEVRLGSLDFTGGTVRVRVHVENPNDYALESGGLRYRLSFADSADDHVRWVTLTEGRDDHQVSIPANDSASAELDVPFEMAPLGTALSRLLRRGALEYRFTGELQVTAPRRVRVPFDRRGTFRP